MPAVAGFGRARKIVYLYAVNITSKTKWRDVEVMSSTFTAATVQRLQAAAVRRFVGLDSLWAMSLAQFIELGECGGLTTLYPLDDSALAYYFVDALKAFAADVESKLKACSLATTEGWLHVGELPMSGGEQLVQFMRNFYGCDYKAAEQTTMSEYLLARRWAYNEQVRQMNLKRHYEQQQQR